MYGMVLMVAVSGSGDTASFGKKNNGCDGAVAAAPAAGCSGGGIFGLRSGGGLFGRKDRGGCTGVVVAAPAPAPCCTPAPVVVAPAPCCTPAPAPCCEPAPAKRGGLFGGLCKKKADCPAPCPPAPKPCCTPAPAPTPCCGAVSAVMPAPVAAPCCGAAAPVAMPAPVALPPAVVPNPLPADKKTTPEVKPKG